MSSLGSHPGEESAIDEMADGTGGVFAHWRPVLGAISGLGAGALVERSRRLRIAAQEESGELAWRCDPIPLPLASEEFRALDAGLRQRAALLERVIDDLYGPQDLLRDGTLPPGLLFPNPGYLHACRTAPGTAAGAVPGTGPRGLQALAVDLVRGPDRRWEVVADRTGGAPGIGYARECRRLLAQVVPELFRAVSVHQLRPFFEAWQDALRFASPNGARVPLVALLCDGPADPHWPEHLALSRDLSCALVTPRDLSVRGGVLFLKALSGLQGVDVLLRRVPGCQLDPLELPGHGGVTGLLEAARCGAVQVVNHPGAEVVEAPALAAFMPALARRLLGEELLVPDKRTLWLGEDGAVRRVAAEPEAWRLRPALRRHGGGMASDAASATPWLVAARGTEPPSTAPCAGAEGLEARPVVLRMFLLHDGTGWRTMEGGLARVMEPGETPGTWPAAGVFKDVWVLREDAALIRGPAPVGAPPLPIRRTAVDMPSRVADDFYWLGRYVERMEGQSRLARAGLRRRARGAPLPREVAELAVLRRCLLASGKEAGTAGAFEEEVRAAFMPDGAIGGGLAHAGRLIDALRDRMTIETFGAFSHALRAARSDVAAALRPEDSGGYDALIHATRGVEALSTTLAGVAAEGMVRGGGRLFLDLGRRIERAMMGARVLGTVLDERPARVDAALRLALEIADSAITYRARYLGLVQPAPVLDLLLADTGNPRALAYQFEMAATLLEAAGDAELAGVAGSMGHAAVALVDRVLAAVPEGADGVETVAVARALRLMGDEVAALSDRVTRRFFALLPRPQSVGLETA